METKTKVVVHPPLPAPTTFRMSPTRPRSTVDLEIIVPAYNEAERISTTLLRTTEYLELQPWSSRVVVVDNGSSDDTGSVVRRLSREMPGRVPISLIGCGRPGKGAAVRRGILSGTSRFTGFFDADMATPVETLGVALEHLEMGAAAVIASRHCPGSSFVRHQRWGRRLGGMAFRALTRSMVHDVHDTQCGFKFFDRRAINQALVQCRTTGFAFDVELLHRLQCEGGRIIEVPVAWTDHPSSTFRPFRDGAASFSSVLHMHKG
ncbi:glycosyltransferase [Kocuria oceani]|uniref:Glycosyltransferase n=2 Tax=Kocuria oceani TaxID=988827 RepID=A0ABV9TEE9_9MICC